MSKKLIFCFDGTCNDPEDAGDFFNDSSISNILKLHILFGGKLSPLNGKNHETPYQQSFYYSGVGTRGNWLSKVINSAFAPPYGDIEDIMKEANNDLEEHYHEGGEIFVFGFSRGAAIARMFASKCAKKDIKITFLGVFDTVAATRGSLDLNPNTYPASDIVFENGTIGQHVSEALHLLAIDEKRIAFQPTLFNEGARTQEIWFAGVHSDIGGGYWFDGLSDITLEFMVNKISTKLQLLKESELNYDALKILNSVDFICWDDINIKPLAHGVLHEQKRSGIKAKTLASRLVRVNKNDSPSSTEVPIVHHTVLERFKKVASYRPYALRGREFKVIGEDGVVSDTQYIGVSGI